MDRNEVKLPNGDVLNVVTGIVWRKGRAWIFGLAIAALLLPELASARGPIVETGSGLWGAVVEFFRNLSH